ncbi:MAG: hypothetical protein MI747_08030 [Desulfobacterales bacterium]|nr:hypothetical protein [Desulfobacterales bacterium]
MEIKYCCKNENCENPENEPYVKVVEVDAIMDEKNLAALYCPHCKSELVQDTEHA